MEKGGNWNLFHLKWKRGKLEFISILLHKFLQSFYRNFPGVVFFNLYQMCQLADSD